MTATLSDRTLDDVQEDFVWACALLTSARREQRATDTPAARAQLELCQARVDAILDDWNAARHSIA